MSADNVPTLQSILEGVKDAMEQAPPPPFNGATRVYLSPDAFEALKDIFHLAPYTSFYRKETMGRGAGVGFRDPEGGDVYVFAENICWALMPAEKKEPTL